MLSATFFSPLLFHLVFSMLILSIRTIHHLQIKKHSLLVKVQIPATLPITTPHLGYASPGPNIYSFSLTKVPSWFLCTPGLKSSNLVYQMELHTELKLKLRQQFSVKNSYIFKGGSHFGLLQLMHDLGLFFFFFTSSFSSYVAFNFQYHDRNFLKKKKMEFKHFSICRLCGHYY